MILPIIAWLIVVVGFLGGGFAVIASISEARHRRRLKEMKAEADLRRAEYFVLSDKIDDLPPRAKSRQ